jgi:casein kinase 1, gamma
MQRHVHTFLYAGKEHILHVLDYGLAKPYIDSETNKHIAFSEHRSITGLL